MCCAQADLQRALEAVTVDDCSHHECSECGVCGDEFGDNVVAESPEIPKFEVPPLPAWTTLHAQSGGLQMHFQCPSEILLPPHD
eukprot:scaffold25070_cov44-Prasinocladus_malaysianus.AAC.1